MRMQVQSLRATVRLVLRILTVACLAPSLAVAHGLFRNNSDALYERAPVVATTPLPTSAWETASLASFTAFESGQTRPLALSPNGDLLIAANTPDNRLEVYRVTGAGLLYRASIAVGLEPVAVAARSNSEFWVVNHLSDSVSIVSYDDATQTGRVERTLLVGDEPRDIVFGGATRNKAFITTAHRGQNAPDPQLTTPGVGRADVWIYDANNLGNDLNGSPLEILTLFTDTPRALAVSPDGSRVYAAGFHTGNQTTTVLRSLLPAPGELLIPPMGPLTNHQGIPAPFVSSVLHLEGGHWLDAEGNRWDQQVQLSLPDKDVFTINADAAPPKVIDDQTYASVGTVLFNMAVNPVSGAVYVSNTDANNKNRFEGPGLFYGSSIRGHLVESRITVLKSGAVMPRHLNKHIDYNAPPEPLPNPTNAKSLAFPQEMAVSSDGARLYVAALGSDKVGVFATKELEDDSFVPSENAQIRVSGGGPTGLVIDEARNRLYVLTRFDDGISTISLSSNAEVAHVKMYNPEPARVTRGRRLLYDAALTSAKGDSACASCHVFGDMDSLAWDLGNPDGDMLNNPGPYAVVGTEGLLEPNLIPGGLLGIALPVNEINFHPMKGPMMTQSLRGMDNHGPMHWRGDRTGGNDETSAQPNKGSFDEVAAFKKFNGAFVDLMGRDKALTLEDMQAFADFALELTYPPNPIRNLDNSLTPLQTAGKDDFFNFPLSDQTTHCVDCHETDRDGNAGKTRHPGFFGTDGVTAFAFQHQSFKVPHLRNLYQKVGRFGFAFSLTDINLPQDGVTGWESMGDQVSGFGFAHDGSLDTVQRFDSNSGFNNHQLLNKREGARELEAFLLAFDSNLYPIVGQQVTFTNANQANAASRVDLLLQRARARECDLVARATVSGKETGYLYQPGLLGWAFVPSIKTGASKTDGQLRSNAVTSNTPVTYLCVPPGNGARIALDRDLDGVYDNDERTAGTNPADPNSH